MNVVELHASREWEWRRVGAWSGSFAAHLLVLALVAAPWAASRVAPTPPRAPTVVTLIEPPPPTLPEPPPPVPPPPHVRKTVPTKPAPVPVAPVPAPAPPVATADPGVAAPVPAPPGDALTQSPPASAAGAMRSLAYDGALRPAYPIASMRAREQGRVVLRVRVGIDGRVEQVEIERSSGYPKLDAAARDAVLRGRFRPVLQDGHATAAWGLVPIEFRLDHA